MGLITCGNHTIRKALSLSMNEMGVLVDIINLSTNPRTNYICTKSKRKMAEWLDLNVDTVFTILKSLEKRGYIERVDGGCRPTKMITDINTCQDIGLYIKNGEVEMMTVAVRDMLDAKNTPIGNSDTHKQIDHKPSEIPIGISEIPIATIGNPDSHLKEIINGSKREDIPPLPKETPEEEPQRPKTLKRGGDFSQGGRGAAAARLLSETEASAVAFAEWFKDNLWPKHIDVPAGYKKSWGEVYVKLSKMGKVKLEIADICKWARADEFWSKNFLSPAKLIKKNKEGVLYYDVFKIAMGDKKPQEQTKHKSTGYNPITGERHG